MDSKSNMDFPNEIEEFINSENGVSLILKGPPGSGKTTLALQILEHFQEKNKIIYLSTRVGDVSLHKQFPWLKEMEKNLKLLITSKLFIEQTFQEILEEENPVNVYGRKLLEEMTGEPPKKIYRIMFKRYLKESEAAEVKRVYDSIESNLPNKSVIVIDSIEGFTSMLNISIPNFVYMFQKDLVEGVNSNIVFVSEEDARGPEDYIVDGVVNLDYKIEDGKRLRTIYIKKLRSLGIKKPSYCYTLNNGRFHSFSPDSYENLRIGGWEPIKNKKGLYSTGIQDFDNLLDGGIKPGTFFNIEIDREILHEYYTFITNTLVLNYLSQDLKILVMPVPGTSFEYYRNYFKKWVPAEKIDKKIKFIDYSSTDSKYASVIPLGGLDINTAHKLHVKAVSEFMTPKDSPGLILLNHDVLEYIYGADLALKNIFENLSNLKSSEKVTVSLTKPGQKIKDEIANISDYQFKIVLVENMMYIYGIKPKTIYYVITVDSQKGFPNIRLVPVV
ncbi:MAG: gas vesicle protein GvpD P-loop domain-containing protein [Thermoplasmata archaeon]